MIIKEEHAYKGNDDCISYSLIDNVEKADVGCDVNHLPPRNFVDVYLKNRKDKNDFERKFVDDTIIYICNDTGKTLQIIRPYVDR